MIFCRTTASSVYQARFKTSVKCSSPKAYWSIHYSALTYLVHVQNIMYFMTNSSNIVEYFNLLAVYSKYCTEQRHCISWRHVNIHKIHTHPSLPAQNQLFNSCYVC